MIKVKWPSKDATKLSEQTTLIAVLLGGAVGIVATVMYLTAN